MAVKQVIKSKHPIKLAVSNVTEENDATFILYRYMAILKIFDLMIMATCMDLFR